MDDNEEQDFVSTDHDHLVSAITKLDKTQHITEPTRNEPTNINSEFNLIKRSQKFDLNNVVKALNKNANHSKITKKLNSLQKSQALSKPLEKPQAERLKRATGYDSTKKKIEKWDPVVARNRTVDFVSFPLKSISKREHPTKVILANLKSKSSLEKELDEVDPPVEAEEEIEDQNFLMTYQEMLEQRKQLAKLRAQESYKAAKAKRQSKIKSKKYHRILKKERLKQQLKEFEELQKKNPEEALKKLEELEKARALERHTLRHKNTGKWAKNKLVRAKYDKEVRQQLAEQLAVSRGLTQKIQDTESTDEEPDQNEIVPDITLAQDPMNPWMMKRSDKSNIDEEFNFGYKKYLKDKMYKQNDDSVSEDENIQEKVNDLSVLKENILKLNSLEDVDRSANKVSVKSQLPEESIISDTSNEKKYKNIKRKVNNRIIATSKWSVDIIESKPKTISDTEVSEIFETLENKIAKNVENKLKKLKKSIKHLERKPETSKNSRNLKQRNSTDNFESLKFKNKNLKPIIDEELIETNIKDAEKVTQVQNSSGKIEQLLLEEKNPQINTNIDPSRFIEVKPKYLNTALTKGENNLDELDDNDEQIVPKVDIEEVFEEDDVVDSFRQEKQNEINNDKPKEIDFVLPGWGSWGGMGVKAPKRKTNRFITKKVPKIPRRDENKGDIIINELKIPQLQAHKVSELPFPFTRVSDFEASVRVPLGNTFITETAHRKLIRPNVITKAGTIIEPMDEEQLFIKRNLTFKNENIIKLLAKK